MDTRYGIAVFCYKAHQVGALRSTGTMTESVEEPHSRCLSLPVTGRELGEMACKA